MHLIFAIILLSIILVARASSSGSKIAAKKAVQKSDESYYQWAFWNRLDPREQGYNVKSFVENPDNREVVLSEVKECYDLIFAKKPFRQMCPPQTWSNPNLYEQIAERSFRLNKKRAACILCAKRGYAYGVDIGLHLSTFIFPSELDLEVMKWCRDELLKQNKDVCILKEIGGTGALYWASRSRWSRAWMPSCYTYEEVP